jgi:alpha-glucuronidase
LKQFKICIQSMKALQLELDRVYLYNEWHLTFHDRTEILKNVRLKYFAVQPVEYRVDGKIIQGEAYIFKWVDWRWKLTGGKTLTLTQQTVDRHITGPEEPFEAINKIEDFYV